MNELSHDVSPKVSAGGAVIFESYGWHDAADIAGRLKRSLESAGFDVWLDSEHIKPDEADFWTPLQLALDRCKLVIALLSPHSVRLEREHESGKTMSVCHNELIMAVRMKKVVVSVTVIDCEPPLAINQYEPIDLTDWQTSPDAYHEGIEEVLYWIREGLENRARYRVYVDNLSRDRLTFPEEQKAAVGFIGRQWVMKRLSTWLDSPGRCFLLQAEPGSGKTALVAELLRRNPENRILAYHFCQSRRGDTIDARRFVRSIAAMLCGTVPEYRARLRGSEELVRALKADGNAATMFWLGVLEPLHSFTMSPARYILVDGLDEAADEPRASGEISIPRLLSNALEHFPPWLKLVVTSRPHDRILPMFQSAERFDFMGSNDEQLKDVKDYVADRMSAPTLSIKIAANDELRDHAIHALTTLSAGNFQYVELVLDELTAGTLHLSDIDALPNSLAGLYYNRAEARFPDAADYGPARALLSFLLAAREPLTRTDLSAMVELDDHPLRALLRKLDGFVTWEPETGVYRIAHKSIADWLIAPPHGFDLFKADLNMGRRRVLAYCQAWESNRATYAMQHLVFHMLQAGLNHDTRQLIRDGFFAKRRGLAECGDDQADTRALTLALIENGDESGILALARTDNLKQRDGVTAALSTAPESSNAFIDKLVASLLETR